MRHSEQDEGLETEEELRESYPHLYGDVAPGAWDPPEYQLTPEQEKFRQLQKAKLREEMRVAEEHGENYQYIDEITDEMLPTVNFRRHDNLLLAKPTNAFLRSVPGRSNTLIGHGCFINVSKSVSNGVSNDPKN